MPYGSFQASEGSKRKSKKTSTSEAIPGLNEDSNAPIMDTKSKFSLKNGTIELMLALKSLESGEKWRSENTAAVAEYWLLKRCQELKGNVRRAPA